jgi:hypothetical protein
MNDDATAIVPRADHPVGIDVVPLTERRNRLTVAFRFFLALPHFLLVGGPAAVGGWLGWNLREGWTISSGTGLLGVAAGLATLIAWFAIVITRTHPEGLWRLSAYYLRWRVRAISYMALLRDEYPPFGDDDYPASLVLAPPTSSRSRLTVFLRVLLALPHLIVLSLVLLLWAFTTAIAWIFILLTGRYPETLYGFAIGALAWGTRVEAYLLLLRDEYPPFTLRA